MGSSSLAPTAVRLLSVENKCAYGVHAERYDSLLAVRRDDSLLHHEPQAGSPSGTLSTIAPRWQRFLRSRIATHFRATHSIDRGSRGEGAGHLHRGALYGLGVGFLMLWEQCPGFCGAELAPDVLILGPGLFQYGLANEEIPLPERRRLTNIEMPRIGERAFPSQFSLKRLSGETACFAGSRRLRRSREALARPEGQTRNDGSRTKCPATYAWYDCHAERLPETAGGATSAFYT